MYLPSLSVVGAITESVFSVIIVLYAVAYGIWLRKKNARYAHLSSLMLLLSVLLFTSSLLIYYTHGMLNVYSILIPLVIIGSFFILLLPLFFILAVLSHVRSRKVVLILSSIVIVAVIAYFIFMSSSLLDDEEVIASYAISNLLSGHNPYAYSASSILYNMAVSNKIGGLTISSNNSIVGTMDYPALYFLIQVPFYILFHPSYTSVAGYFTGAQVSVFLLALLLVYALGLKRRESIKPDFLSYVVLSWFIVTSPSSILYLAAAIILLLYTKYGERYSWLIFGLLASLQEQTWIFVLIFIAIIFNSKGFKKGLVVLTGTIAVFAAINSYFIIQNPYAFANAFTKPIGLLPGSGSPIGYLAVNYLHASLKVLPYLFILSIVLTVLVALYLNDKKFAILFSIIPFMFLGHGLIVYYLLPVLLFTMVADAKIGAQPAGKVSTALRSSPHLRYAYAASILIILAGMAVIVARSGASYNSTFGIYVHNITISKSNQTTLLINASISNVAPTDTSAYLLVGSGEILSFGFLNDTIIQGVHYCGFKCGANANLLHLAGNGTYSLSAKIPSNINAPTYITIVLYNSTYYYRSYSVTYR